MERTRVDVRKFEDDKAYAAFPSARLFSSICSAESQSTEYDSEESGSSASGDPVITGMAKRGMGRRAAAAAAERPGTTNAWDEETNRENAIIGMDTDARPARSTAASRDVQSGFYRPARSPVIATKTG